MAAQTRPGEIDLRRLAAELKLVSEPTRLGVLLRLGDGERHVSALRAELARSESRFSKHLGLLRGAGLVVFRSEGHGRLYRLTPEGRKLQRGVAALVGGR